MTDKAAAKDAEMAKLKERNAELNMLAYKWMTAHDALAAGKPYEPPHPSDVPNTIARAEAAERERDSLRELLKRLNRRGGLGLDVHEEIDAALKAGKDGQQ